MRRRSRSASCAAMIRSTFANSRSSRCCNDRPSFGRTIGDVPSALNCVVGAPAEYGPNCSSFGHTIDG